MKILIVQTVPGEIYTDKITYNIQPIGLARAFKKAGHRCDIICCADGMPSIKKVTNDDGSEIIIYCVKSKNIIKNGFLQGDIKSIFDKYDILQPIEYNQIYTWHMAMKYKDKVVIYHGPYYSDFNWRYNMMAKVFDLFCASRYRKLNTMFLTKSHLATKYLNDKGINNIETIGVGIDLFAMRSTEDRIHPIAQRIDKFPHQYKLLYIGKIEPRRNCYFLTDILESVRNKGIDAGLVIIGKGEKEYKDGLFEKFSLHELNDYILYEPEIEQKYIAQIYKRTDIFLLPTIYDIYGMVLLEGMYFNQCVVTTVNGGSDMMIQTGENGFVINSFEAKSWGNQICDILRDSERRKRIGKKAHETVVNDFTWLALTGKFVSAYRKKLGIREEQS